MNRNYSLKRNKEFQYVYRAGKSQAAKTMVLIVAKARHNSVKVGFSVGKKVGNSVVRNLIKRRMRESCRILLPTMRTGYSLVFVARGGIEKQPFREVLSNMQFLLKKAGMVQTNDIQGAHVAD